jgi:hypothetical protein
MRRRRWLLVGLLLLPVVGVALAFAAPPLDEYATFDRVGSRHDTAFEPGTEYFAQNRSRSETGRVWRLNLPEGEARHFLGRFTSVRRGWHRCGFGRGGGSREIPETGMMETINSETASYQNKETGDQLHFEIGKQESPVKKFLGATVTVEQSPSSKEPWPKLKRWWHLTTGG